MFQICTHELKDCGVCHPAVNSSSLKSFGCKGSTLGLFLLGYLQPAILVQQDLLAKHSPQTKAPRGCALSDAFLCTTNPQVLLPLVSAAPLLRALHACGHQQFANMMRWRGRKKKTLDMCSNLSLIPNVFAQALLRFPFFPSPSLLPSTCLCVEMGGGCWRGGGFLWQCLL